MPYATARIQQEKACWRPRAKALASNRALHPRRSLILPLLRAPGSHMRGGGALRAVIVVRLNSSLLKFFSVAAELCNSPFGRWCRCVRAEDGARRCAERCSGPAQGTIRDFDTTTTCQPYRPRRSRCTRSRWSGPTARSRTSARKLASHVQSQSAQRAEPEARGPDRHVVLTIVDVRSRKKSRYSHREVSHSGRI
jgi:hypothetical protein